MVPVTLIYRQVLLLVCRMYNSVSWQYRRSLKSCVGVPLLRRVFLKVGARSTWETLPDSLRTASGCSCARLPLAESDAGSWLRRPRNKFCRYSFCVFDRCPALLAGSLP